MSVSSNDLARAAIPGAHRTPRRRADAEARAFWRQLRGAQRRRAAVKATLGPSLNTSGLPIGRQGDYNERAHD